MKYLLDYQASKRLLAKLEGAEDVSQISPLSRFLAGGIGGVVSQFVFLAVLKSNYVLTHSVY